jgi:hypothetical protein
MAPIQSLFADTFDGVASDVVSSSPQDVEIPLVTVAHSRLTYMDKVL